MAPCAQHLRPSGALFSLTNRQFAPFSGTRVGARFWTGKRLKLGSDFPEVQNGEQVTASLKGENGRMP
jgi:hypothetical protein